MSRKLPNPIDIHVGSRVRMRRILIGTSQEKLGEKLGITFQQVQKYEKGTNRIGASRLLHIAHILGVPVDFFFEGLQVDFGDKEESGFGENGEKIFDLDMVSTHEGVQLNAAFFGIHNTSVRKRILDLVKTLHDAERDTTPESASL